MWDNGRQSQQGKGEERGTSQRRDYESKKGDRGGAKGKGE